MLQIEMEVKMFTFQAVFWLLLLCFIDLLQCSIDPTAQTSLGVFISNIFSFATKSCEILVSGGDLIDFEADQFLNFTVS